MASRTFVALATVLLGTGLPGCADGEQAGATEPPVAVVLAQATPTNLSVEIRSLNGQYGSGCDGREGSWSIAVTAPESELEQPPLRVFTTDLDAACKLTLTELVVRPSGDDGPEDDLKYTAPPPGIALDPDYAAQAVAFANAGSTQLYGNARMVSGSGSSEDFRIELRVSPSVTVGVIPVGERNPPS